MCVSPVSLAWLVGVHDELTDGCAGPGGYQGGYTGVGTRRGNTGAPSQLLEEVPQTAERAP